MERLTIARGAVYIRDTYGEYITTDTLKAWVRSGRCPFGEYIRKTGKQRGMFLLFRERMDEYFKPKHDVKQTVADGLYLARGGGSRR